MGRRRRVSFVEQSSELKVRFGYDAALVEEIKRLPPGGNEGDCLRIGSTSHPWQQPDNPDPKGINLALLARFLEVLLSKGDATYAIFFE